MTPPRVTAPKHMPAQPMSHTPTSLRPLAGNSDIVLTEALVAAKRATRTACSGDIYSNAQFHVRITRKPFCCFVSVIWNSVDLVNMHLILGL